MSGNDTGDGDAQMQKFELYIKASAIDKETKGSCPICQQFFMITCLLGENQDDIDFKVFTVQADCPPKNFASGWSKKYPVVMVNSGRNKAGQDISGMMYDTFEDLEIFFASINKECPELKSANAPNQSAMAVVGNLYKYFNHFIAGQPEKALVGELRKLNEYLESQDTKYMVDNVLSFSDCHLLPRLQHIRVAGKAYRDFDIPKEFTYIWRYLKNAYEQDAFKSTMPSDQDIIKNYEKKACNLPKVKSKGNPTLEKFTYLMDVPEDILETIYNGTSASSDGGATQVEETEVAPVPEPTPEVEPEQREPSPEPEPPVETEQEPEAAPVEQQQQEEEPEAAPVEQQQQEEPEAAPMEQQQPQEEEKLEPTPVEQQQEPEPTPVEPSEEPQTGGTGDSGLEETSPTTTKTEGTDITEKIASSAPNGDVQGQVEAAQ